MKKFNVHIVANGIDIKRELHFLKQIRNDLDKIIDCLGDNKIKDSKGWLKLDKEILGTHIKDIYLEDKVINNRIKSGDHKNYVKNGYILK